MNDRNKESLSALMDGEADELEIRRILNQLDSDEAVREHWKNYHLMGSLMRDEAHDSLDLTQGINNVLDGKVTQDELLANNAEHKEQPLERQTRSNLAGSRASFSPSTWYKPLTSVAVAASVTLAVLLGVQSIDPAGSALQPPAELAASNVSQQQHQILTQQQQDVLESAQQQLQEYVLKQSQEDEVERTGMMPFARVVEFEGKGASKKSDLP